MSLCDIRSLFLLLLLKAPNVFCDDNSKYVIGGVFSADMRDTTAHSGFHFAANKLAKKFLYSYYDYEELSKNPAVVEYVDDISNNFQISSAICRLVSRGVYAIFGPMHYKTVNMVMSLTDYFEVVYFTYSDVYDFGPELKQGRYIVRLRPNLNPAVISFVRLEDWHRIYYLYDSKEALLRLRGIFDVFNRRQHKLSADPRYIGDDSKDVLRFIREAGAVDSKRIILDITRRKSRDILLNQIDELRMKRTGYHYCILGVDINEVNLTTYQYGGVNITGFSLIDNSIEWVSEFIKNQWFSEYRLKNYPCSTDKYHQPNNVLPLDAALLIDGVKVFFKALSKTKVSKPVRRHVNEACIPPFTPKYKAQDLVNTIRNVTLEGLTGVLSFDNTSSRKDYSVSVVQIGMRSALRESGIWSAREGLVLVDSKNREPKPIENVTRIVTSILSKPFLMWNNMSKDGRPNVGNDRFVGFCADLIKIISRRLNFNYIIVPVKDGKYGSEVNKTWNGMIGELSRREADIAVAPLTITSSREKIVDFTKPFMEVGISIMYVRPEEEGSDVFSFMKPLSTEIWMCIGFAYLGVSVVLFLVSRFSPYEWHFNKEDGDDSDYDEEENNLKIENDFSIFNSFWFSLSTFMQQGGEILPMSLSGRIVGSVWWFFTLIIVSSYTANLAAFLTVQRMNTPIESYNDLATQTKIKYGVVNSGSSKEFFKTSKVAAFRRMWMFMRSNPQVFVKSIQEGFERVKSSNRAYAFLLESTMNEFYQGQQPCATMKVGGNLDSGKGYGIATPPGSDLWEKLNLEILYLKETNKIHEIKLKWWDKRSQCQETDVGDSTTSALDLSKVWGLFYILLGGFLVGVILTAVEFFYKCVLEMKHRKCSFQEVFSEMFYLALHSKFDIGSSLKSCKRLVNRQT